jgi:membrane protein implicated in regulation of membrane protease activity
MASYLDWQNLIFVLPLAGGVLLVLVAALGLAEFDADMDVDAEPTPELEADGDAEALDNAAASWSSLLGVGRVPLSIVWMVLLVVFGGIGLCTSSMLSHWIDNSTVVASCSVPIAAVGSLAATSVLTRLIARLLPDTESYVIGKEQLIGCMGTAELDILQSFGVANVVDQSGTLHKVRCRALGTRIDKGSAVLIIDYDAERDFFFVEKSPL